MLHGIFCFQTEVDGMQETGSAHFTCVGRGKTPGSQDVQTSGGICLSVPSVVILEAQFLKFANYIKNLHK